MNCNLQFVSLQPSEASEQSMDDEPTQVAKETKSATKVTCYGPASF